MQTLKKIIFLINLLVAIALLLAFLSPQISPDISYLPQMFALGYKPLLLVNIGFVLFWFFLQRKRIVLSFFISLLFLLYAPRLYHFSFKKSTETEGMLSIISYNVKSFSKIENKDVFKFLKEEDADIICFQEYSNAEYKKRGRKLLKTNYSYSQINRKKRETAIFSKYPIIRKKDILFDSNHNCSGISADIVIGKDTVRVFNIHLESNRISENNQTQLEGVFKNKKTDYGELRHIGAKIYQASKRRMKQVRILKNLVKKSPYKVILCGDFNDTPLSYTYEVISDLLSDSFVGKGNGSGATYVRGIIDVRIDYVFSSFDTQEHKVFTVPYSDHFPIKAVLRKEN